MYPTNHLLSICTRCAIQRCAQDTVHLNLNSLSYKCVQLCADIVPLALDCFSVSGNWMFPWILGFQKAISAKCIVSLLVQGCRCVHIAVTVRISFFLALNTTAATQQIHFLLLREAQCQTFCSQTCTRNSSFAIAPKAYSGTAICAAVIILWGI